MKSPREILKLSGPPIMVCMLLLPWAAAVNGEEQVGSHSETKLTVPDGAARDYFGLSVAISGDTAVIGARGDDDLGEESGSAYVFERDRHDPALWTQTAELNSEDGSAGRTFGVSVAISGDTAVIGAPVDYDMVRDPGAAYIFERDPLDPTIWTQTARLRPRDLAVFDLFAYSVAISGDTVVVGAYSDDRLGEDAGSAFVFERDPADRTIWTRAAKLTAADAATDDYFGYSVAVSEDTVMVGSKGDDDLGAFSGSVYVFGRDPVDPTVWIQTAKLTAADGAPEDRFGLSVALSDDTAVIGAYFDDDLGDDSGSSYVFERDRLDSSVWTQTAKLTAAEGEADDHFGNYVAISGDTAVIGSDGDDDLGLGSGSAYMFKRDPLDPAVWSQIAKLTAADGTEGDAFGVSVAVSGQAVVIGADGDDDHGISSGSAYAYSPASLLRLALAGSCPGSVTIEVTGATPAGRVAMLASPSLGTFTLPGGPCAGTDLDLASPELLRVLTADGDGNVSRTMQVPPVACGVNLQALDLRSCGTTNVERVP